MITLPETFSVATLVGDFFDIAAPFVGVAFLVAGGFLIIRSLQKL